MFAAGKSIGPYVLHRELGRGQFGVVWLAQMRTHLISRPVAVKLPLQSDVDLEVIRREAGLWSLASGHSNVLPLILADVHDGQVAISAEYAPSGTLVDWIGRHPAGIVLPERACSMCSGILAGLAHLHSRTIIHRDLKPGNILLHAETPRIADFGLARALRPVVVPWPAGKGAVATCNFAGTPAYMAPEAWRGTRSESTDLWSVAVMLYEMLTGRRPFQSHDLRQLHDEIRHSPPRPSEQFIPPKLWSVIEKGLHKNPAERFASAAAMREALDSLSFEVIVPGPPESLKLAFGVRVLSERDQATAARRAGTAVCMPFVRNTHSAPIKLRRAVLRTNYRSWLMGGSTRIQFELSGCELAPRRHVNANYQPGWPTQEVESHEISLTAECAGQVYQAAEVRLPPDFFQRSGSHSPSTAASEYLQEVTLRSFLG